MAQQNTTPKRLEERDTSGVFLSSVDIKVSRLPLQSELDGVLPLVQIVLRSIPLKIQAHLTQELARKPNVINPLSVSNSSLVKQRLILDLRHVNQYIYKQKFKCKDVSVATQLFSRNCYLFKFDLKSSYHLVEMFPDHRKFLFFAWEFNTGVCRYFQFCVFPIGFSSPPYILIKILKPLQKSWSSQGIPIAIFLDDGLGGGMDFVSAKVSSLVVHSNLRDEFVLNEEKFLWEPVQIITWLGVIRCRWTIIPSNGRKVENGLILLTTEVNRFSLPVSFFFFFLGSGTVLWNPSSPANWTRLKVTQTTSFGRFLN